MSHGTSSSLSSSCPSLVASLGNTSASSCSSSSINNDDYYYDDDCNNSSSNSSIGRDYHRGVRRYEWHSTVDDNVPDSHLCFDEVQYSHHSHWTKPPPLHQSGGDRPISTGDSMFDTSRAPRRVKDTDKGLSCRYPSVQDVEAIVIPSCDEIFAMATPKSTKPAPNDNSIDCNDGPELASPARRHPRCHGSGHALQRYDSSESLVSWLEPSASENTLQRDDSSESLVSWLEPSDTENYEPLVATSTISLAPGITVPFYGPLQTIHAARHGQVIRCVCLYCHVAPDHRHDNNALYCVALATSVLCSTCRQVSPIDTHDQTTSVAAVGIGLYDIDIW